MRQFYPGYADAVEGSQTGTHISIGQDKGHNWKKCLLDALLPVAATELCVVWIILVMVEFC